MKKNILLISSLFIALSLASCNDNKVNSLTFAQNEYVLASGEAISINEKVKNVEYFLIDNPYANVTIDSKTGVIHFDNSIPNYAQVLVGAKSGDIESIPCVVTLIYTYEETVLTFLNKSTYITNGEHITASSDKNYSLTYSLKEEVPGISIEPATGKITFSPIVQNNVEFTVIVDSHGTSKKEQTFKTLTEGFVSVESNRQIIESSGNTKACYKIDFSGNSEAMESGVLSVVTSDNIDISPRHYKFDAGKNQLIIYPSIAEEISIGINDLKIITARNAIQIELDVATKFIYNAYEFASINNSEAALSGYYVLMQDIDLSEYIASTATNSWLSIGGYDDVIDMNVATRRAFKGTFDGNGHVVTGYKMKAKDATGFNAGLFGYCTGSSLITNIGVRGEMDVASYSGGLVGSNSGTVSNSFADVNVSVYSGEDVYRFVGGLVGSNLGIIENCYVTGDVYADKSFGLICGNNEGTVNNCYSYVNTNCDVLVGVGTAPTNCQLFNSLEEMTAFDFSSVLPSTNFKFETGKLPQVKSPLVNYLLQNIVINIADQNYYKGNKIPFSISLYPESYNSYLSDVEVEVEGEGYYIKDNQIYTLNKKEDYVTIKASLTIDGETYSDAIRLLVNDPITSLTFTPSSTSLQAGMSYELTSNATPLNMNDPIRYETLHNYTGVSINGNVLTISDDCTYNQIIVYAISDSGVKSSQVTFNVKKQTQLAPVVAYENATSYSIDVSTIDVKKVSLNGVDVAYSKVNNTITIDATNAIKDTLNHYVIEDTNGKLYGVDTYKMSHEAYNETNKADAIKIYSKDDFYTYFNISLDSLDVSKYANYSKSFILMNDIDFEGAEILGIGYIAESVSSHPFEGYFYGNGHSISNYTINYNELYLTGDSNSSKYGVGLFGGLTGEVYDVTIKNAAVYGFNFVGGLVGMQTSGRIENCKGYNVSTMAGDSEYSYDEVHASKILGRYFGGETLALYYENSLKGVIG